MVEKRQMEEENYSLFDTPEEKGASQNGKLDIVYFNYVHAKSLTWKELFSGYNTIRAITYSSGINFVYQLLDMFDQAEIIFGCEDIMSYTMQEIMAFQGKMLERMRHEASRRKLDLIGRIESGSVHFWVAKGKLSHEKIYLLQADDGRKRVIMGSANMSYNAFSGHQRENICCVDGDEAYDWYLDIFENLKNESSDEITQKALKEADLGENLDSLPVSHTIKVKRALVIEPIQEARQDIEFILDVKRAAGELGHALPKADKKTGKVTITPDILIKARRHVIEEAVKQKELRSEYPQLAVDAENSRVTLNGEVLNLIPASEEIRRDVELFISYMNGYEKFHGDFTGMQSRYFEFANWFFCTPFMATMRDVSARYNQNRLPYPVYGLLYGQSKAGKTSFLETLLKMMIGQKPKISAVDFTRSSIEKLKYAVQGAPIIVDDLTNTRFNQHAIETIKNDDFGVAEHLRYYPAVVISANEDVKAVAPEVIRRTVICRVEAGLTNTEVMKSNVVRKVQGQIGTALYREYLARMLEAMPDLIEQIKDEDTEAPDILKLSSDILVAIISENITDVPGYIRPLSLEDYFSEQVTGKYAIKTIQNAWRINKKAFKISAKNNEIRYNAGTTYEADRLMKELPETLEARKSREWVVMKLDEANQFFGIKFKLKLFER